MSCLEVTNMSGFECSSKPTTSVSSDERTWAMLCHLSTFAGLIGVPFGNILGPLIAWMIKRDEYALVEDQGKEALNFQISMMIYSLICLVLIITIPLIFALLVIDIVYTIIAAIRANAGEYYRYPMTIRLLK
jgi:uncharacterized Tic20 family protein